jgi:hypothetical protein
VHAFPEVRRPFLLRPVRLPVDFQSLRLAAARSDSMLARLTDLANSSRDIGVYRLDVAAIAERGA